MSTTSEHEFGALNTLLLVLILGLCIWAAYSIKQNSLYYIPESAAAIFVGLVVGGIASILYPSREELAFLTFEPELFFFFLLPPIIFEAGYSLKKRDFFTNFWTIALFAFFGTIISTFLIGFCIYLIGVLGFVHINTTSPMESLIFGALISSVDPVATLSIMGNPELNCDPLLYSLVFGESVLNDAVAIVLFKAFMHSYDSGTEFSTQAIWSVLSNFTMVCSGSCLLGSVIGLICSYTYKNSQIRKYPEYEVAGLFLFAYGGYAIAEASELSGIMSLFCCGMILSHYNSNNLSLQSQVTAHTLFKSAAVLAEFFVFVYIGMGIFTFKHWDFSFFLFCTSICLLSRIFNVFPLSYLANLGRNKKIPLKMQIVIWFAGLRGAISFALSMQMPGEHRELFVSTTLSIVIFTTVFCGGLTEPLLTKMGMKVDSKEIVEAGLLQHESIAASSSLTTTPGSSGTSTATTAFVSRLFQRLEIDYMQPIFGGKTPAESASRMLGDSHILGGQCVEHDKVPSGNQDSTIHATALSDDAAHYRKHASRV